MYSNISIGYHTSRCRSINPHWQVNLLHSPPIPPRPPLKKIWQKMHAENYSTEGYRNCIWVVWFWNWSKSKIKFHVTAAILCMSYSRERHVILWHQLRWHSFLSKLQSSLDVFLTSFAYISYIPLTDNWQEILTENPVLPFSHLFSHVINKTRATQMLSQRLSIPNLASSEKNGFKSSFKEFNTCSLIPLPIFVG